ncbi:hypothetical protein [Tomitella fengzijianii]|uniref:Uncharacterized protein n=1 Tax=Tomitella fengzijianii TaxID=2597660 RepID=A0A516X6M0_9ACTN|nr:hypothetical protein [Tomitella fengzijianii]QDQ98706.1 hypothetical protein FO059_16935 [Tomitella fengzijianii]
MSPEQAWAEAFGRMKTAAVTTIHGRMRCESPAGDATNTYEIEFWHEAPDRWRIEDEYGLWYLDDGDRVLLRTDNGIEHVSLTGHLGPRRSQHPRTVLGNAFGAGRMFGWAEDFPRPLNSGTPVTVAGRQATEFQLAASPGRYADKPYPLRVAADDQSGLPLRIAVPEKRHVREIVAIDLDAALPPDVFAWHGAVSTATRDAHEHRRAGQNWAREQQLPVPRWWPRGVHYYANEGDPDTGAFRAVLDVNSLAVLLRWPCGSELPDSWKDGFRTHPVHRWDDERWQWALLVDTPLSDDDLARVIESIPQDQQ